MSLQSWGVGVRSGGKGGDQFRGYSGMLAGEGGEPAHNSVGGEKPMESKIFKDRLDSFMTL